LLPGPAPVEPGSWRPPCVASQHCRNGCTDRRFPLSRGEGTERTPWPHPRRRGLSKSGGLPDRSIENKGAAHQISAPSGSPHLPPPGDGLPVLVCSLRCDNASCSRTLGYDSFHDSPPVNIGAALPGTLWAVAEYLAGEIGPRFSSPMPKRRTAAKGTHSRPFGHRPPRPHFSQGECF